MAINPATVQEFRFDVQPSKGEQIAKLLAGVTGGYLKGRTSRLTQERERKLEIADEQRKMQGNLLTALINKGELVQVPKGSKGSFDFAGLSFASPSSQGGGIQIRTAEDFKNFTQGLKNQAEAKFKAPAALAGIMKSLSEGALYTGQSETDPFRDFMSDALDQVSDLIDQGDISTLQSVYNIPPELVEEELSYRRGARQPASKEELSAAFSQGTAAIQQPQSAVQQILNFGVGNAEASSLTQDPANYNEQEAARRIAAANATSAAAIKNQDPRLGGGFNPFADERTAFTRQFQQNPNAPLSTNLPMALGAAVGKFGKNYHQQGMRNLQAVSRLPSQAVGLGIGINDALANFLKGAGVPAEPLPPFVGQAFRQGDVFTPNMANIKAFLNRGQQAPAQAPRQF